MKKLLSLFYPDRRFESVYDVDFEGLYKEGIRGIIFDIDNTLVPHGADADKKIEALFGKIKAVGLKTCLLSNNREERVKRFNKNIQSLYIFKAGKPSKRGYLEAVSLMNTSIDTTLVIGDQLFTDIYGAKRVGMKNILLSPIDGKEEIQIVLKRYLEKIVLGSYERERKAGRQI